MIWWKGRAAGGSCAWGTFQRPANPVLRDITERVVIASKVASTAPSRRRSALARDLPSTATISRDEFMEATTDLWEIAPESATRVGHPAPFPVELPKRLIELYTYEGDVVLDPFMGSGSAAVAAVRTGRHYIGFDTDPATSRTAERRIADERARLRRPNWRSTVRVPGRASRGRRAPMTLRTSRRVRSGRDGRPRSSPGSCWRRCGFIDIRADVKPRGLGIMLNFVATDETGEDWAFDVSGAFTSNRAGLRRTDTLWKSLGKAAVLHESALGLPLVLLTTDAPAKGTAGHQALNVMRGPTRPVFDLIELLNIDDQARLHHYAIHGRPD